MIVRARPARVVRRIPFLFSHGWPGGAHVVGSELSSRRRGRGRPPAVSSVLTPAGTTFSQPRTTVALTAS